MKKIISIEEKARNLKVSRQTAYRWLWADKLKADFQDEKGRVFFHTANQKPCQKP